MRSLVATIFGRATLVLPSCDGPFTWIVWALVVLTQRALTLFTDWLIFGLQAILPTGKWAK